jgi:hypothetical protein
MELIFVVLFVISVVRLLMALHRNNEFGHRQPRPPQIPEDPLVRYYMRRDGHYFPPQADDLSEKGGHGSDWMN